MNNIGKLKHESFKRIILRDNGESIFNILSKRTLKDLLKELNLLSEQAIDYGYVDEEIEDQIETGKYKFIGDLFEIFAEVFFILYKSDNRVGLYDYEPVAAEDDNGVDGFGKNIEGKPTTVQVKYRGNPTYRLTERDLKQFPYQSIINYNIDWNRNDNMIVFTNCRGLHWYTESKVFNYKIRVINSKIISSLIDNNEGFWNSFKQIVIESVEAMEITQLTKHFHQKLL